MRVKNLNFKYSGLINFFSPPSSISYCSCPSCILTYCGDHGLRDSCIVSSPGLVIQTSDPYNLLKKKIPQLMDLLNNQNKIFVMLLI